MIHIVITHNGNPNNTKVGIYGIDNKLSSVGVTNDICVECEVDLLKLVGNIKGCGGLRTCEKKD